MRKINIKKIFSIKNNYLLYIIIASIFICFPLLTKIPYGHDIKYHITNYLQIVNNFSLEKLFISKIYNFGNIANGFGYGIRIFYPPISYLFTTFIYFILKTLNVNNLSLTISYTSIIIVILSGISMYKFVKNVFNSKNIAIISSISYISSTYLLCDVFVRTAIAEELTFIFIPIIFDGLYELFYGSKKKFFLKFIVGYVGIINSHLIISIYVTIFIIIIFLFNIRKILKKEYIINLIVASFYILMISSPFLIPLIEHKLYGNYVVFDNSTMFSLEELKYNSLSIYDLFHIGNRTDNGIKVYFNYATFIMFLLSLINYSKIFKSEKYKRIIKSMIIILILSIFISSNIFPWHLIPNFLKNIQFPWRICIFMTFIISFLSGIFIKTIKEENIKNITIIVCTIIILFGFNSIDNNNFSNYIEIDNYHLGEQAEYFPKNIQNKSEYYDSRSNEIMVLKGKANCDIINNNEEILEANINLKDNDSVIIELPRVYYLGYQVTYKEKDNVKKIKYQESPNGFIELKLKESGILTLKYKGTFLTHCSYIISIFSFIFFIILYNKILKE